MHAIILSSLLPSAFIQWMCSLRSSIIWNKQAIRSLAPAIFGFLRKFKVSYGFRQAKLYSMQCYEVVKQCYEVVEQSARTFLWCYGSDEIKQCCLFLGENKHKPNLSVRMPTQYCEEVEQVANRLGWCYYTIKLTYLWVSILKITLEISASIIQSWKHRFPSAQRN
jgi:hypothetical protein